MFFIENKFQFPKQLAQAIAESVWGGPQPSPSEIDRVGRRLRLLWPQLAKERGQQESNHYSFSQDATEAYAAYYLAANAMKLPLILEEMNLLGLRVNDQSTWLDFGAGPGTSLAGLAWWCQNRSQQFKVHSIEQSKLFIDFGERLAQKLSQNLPLSKFVSRWKKSDQNFEEALQESGADVVCFSNSLGEIAPTLSEKQALVQRLVQAKSTRWLIFIEPASQAASRELLELRQLLAQDPRCKIWLPCFSARSCGALTDPKDWCHEEAECEFPAWHNTIGALAGLQKQSLLFSYLVVSVHEHPTPEWNTQTKRMVSQRLEQKGQTVCYLCTESGKQKVRVQHSKANDSNRYFLSVRRGQFFSHVLAADKGDIIDFKNDFAGPFASSSLFPTE